MRVGVDARPLCVPTFGIGRYLASLMGRFVEEPDIEWFLYADRPLLDTCDADTVTVRTWPAANSLLSLYRTQVGFARLAQRDRVDLFWSPRHHLPLRLPAGIPTVVTIHDLVWKRYPETMLPRNRLVERLLMPPSLRRADAIIAVSQSTRDDLTADYPAIAGKVNVIYEAAEAVEVEVASDGRYFVFLGTLEPRKNLERLIEAFAVARPRLGDDVRLVILGAQGWSEPISSVVHMFQCDDVVDVLGRVDERTLHEYLEGAIALCLPSLYEGFGLPALEAMQHGTPVIGSDVSSVPEVVGEGGILVDPRSIREICDAMVQLATDAALRERLAAAAVGQSKRFSWEDAAAKTLALFRRLATP